MELRRWGSDKRKFGLSTELINARNARNVSFSISARWSIYFINSVDKPNFRKRCIAWLYSVYQISYNCLKLAICFFFSIFSVEFLIFLNTIFSECATQNERDHYCVNGGTCFRIPAINNDPHCHCPAEFTGKRCEQYVIRRNL